MLSAQMESDFKPHFQTSGQLLGESFFRNTLELKATETLSFIHFISCPRKVQVLLKKKRTKCNNYF